MNDLVFRNEIKEHNELRDQELKEVLNWIETRRKSIPDDYDWRVDAMLSTISSKLTMILYD
jgi:hypothetical protein